MRVWAQGSLGGHKTYSCIYSSEENWCNVQGVLAKGYDSEYFMHFHLPIM